MLKRLIVTAFLAIAALSPSLAQEQRQPIKTGVERLQEMVGNLAGQNAEMISRLEIATQQIADLQKLLAAEKAKHEPAPQPQK